MKRVVILFMLGVLCGCSLDKTNDSTWNTITLQQEQIFYFSDIKYDKNTFLGNSSMQQLNKGNYFLYTRYIRNHLIHRENNIHEWNSLKTVFGRGYGNSLEFSRAFLLIYYTTTRVKGFLVLVECDNSALYIVSIDGLLIDPLSGCRVDLQRKSQYFFDELFY